MASSRTVPKAVPSVDSGLRLLLELMVPGLDD